jgi:hypothetical protein
MPSAASTENFAFRLASRPRQPRSGATAVKRKNRRERRDSVVVQRRKPIGRAGHGDGSFRSISAGGRRAGADGPFGRLGVEMKPGRLPGNSCRAVK